MKKNDFVKAITEKVRATEKFEVTLKETEAYLDALKETVAEIMADGDDVSIPGFVKFSVADVPARDARNPRTGEIVKVPAKKKVKLKVLTELKNSVQ